MDIDNDDIGYLVKLSLPSGKGSAIVNSDDQMVKREAKSEIVPLSRVHCQRKGHWLRSCQIYLKDHKAGKVNKFDSTSGKVHYLTLLSFYSEILDT